MDGVEVGMWVVPRPTFEAAGLDWQVADIVGEAVILRWVDRSYKDVFRYRVVRGRDLWEKYEAVTS